MADVGQLLGEVLQNNRVQADNSAQTIQEGARNAIQAHQIATNAQMAREKLEIDKQNQEMNKAQWLTQQIDQINRMDGHAQKIAIDNFQKQAKQVYPNMDPGTIELLKKDPDFGRNMNEALQEIAKGDPSKIDWSKVNSMAQQTAPQVWNIAQGFAQRKAAVAAAQMKTEALSGRVDEQRNQNAAAAGNHFETDKIIQSSKQNLNSLEKSSSILTKGNGPVTAKDLNLAYNDYINATAPGGNATEGKVSRELPETWAQQWNELQQRVGDTQDLRKTPAGQALISQLTANISNVRRDMHSQIANQAKNIAQNYSSTTNPRVKSVVQQKLQTYGNLGGQENTQPQQAQGAGAGGGETKVWNGVTYQKQGNQWVAQPQQSAQAAPAGDQGQGG